MGLLRGTIIALAVASGTASAQTPPRTWTETLADAAKSPSARAAEDEDSHGCLDAQLPTAVHLVSRPDAPAALWMGLRSIEWPTSVDTIQVDVDHVTCAGDGESLSTIVLVWNRRPVTLSLKYDTDWDGRGIVRSLYVENGQGLDMAYWDGHALRPAAVVIDSLRRAVAGYEASQRAAQRRAAQAEKTRADRIRSFGWPPGVTEAVIGRRVTIGMSNSQVRAALGGPQHIKTKIDAAGTEDIWFYGRTSITFSNGIVRSMETVR